jgi:hypothetical protein
MDVKWTQTKQTMAIMQYETDLLQHPQQLHDHFIHYVWFGILLVTMTVSLTLFMVGYKYTLPQSLLDRDMCHIMCDRAQFNLTAILQTK